METLSKQHLIETEELAERIADGDNSLRVVDMRGFVRTRTDETGKVQSADYLGAKTDYAVSHIPGALYFDWTKDLIDPEAEVPVQAASGEQFAALLEGAGIGNEHTVIAYDHHPASQFATRLWWLFHLYGHHHIRVLNGGWTKWIREAREVTTETPVYPKSSFLHRLQPEWRATAEDVLSLLHKDDVTLIDARDEAQFTGAIRRATYGGRIPGAIHLPREAFFSEESTFQPVSILQDIAAEQKLDPEKRIVAYCNGGVAATTVLFTLSMLGYTNLTNYDGSWNEWGERDDLPRE